MCRALIGKVSVQLLQHISYFQIVNTSKRSIEWKNVSHHHKVNLFATTSQLYSMQSIKFYQQRSRILLQVSMVVWKDAEKEGVFGGANGFDDETVVLGVVKQAAALSRRIDFRKDVFSG